jgi:hypothetical protein
VVKQKIQQVTGKPNDTPNGACFQMQPQTEKAVRQQIPRRTAVIYWLSLLRCPRMEQLPGRP